MKQSSFYILAAMPAFALMLALLIFALLREPLLHKQIIPVSNRIFNYTAMVILIISILVPPLVARNNHRDQDELQMIHRVQTMIPAESILQINPAMSSDWSLHSYFARLAKVSLDPSQSSSARFYLTTEELLPNDTLSKSFSELSHLNGFVLFQK